MLLSCTFRITELHYTFGCPSLIKGYVCMFYLQNYWVTLHLWVRSLSGAYVDLLYVQYKWVTLHL